MTKGPRISTPAAALVLVALVPAVAPLAYDPRKLCLRQSSSPECESRNPCLAAGLHITGDLGVQEHTGAFDVTAEAMLGQQEQQDLGCADVYEMEYEENMKRLIGRDSGDSYAPWSHRSSSSYNFILLPTPDYQLLNMTKADGCWFLYAVEGGTLLGVGSTCSAVAATTFGAAAFTQEANAYYEGVQHLGGDAVVDSKEACESLCSNSTACTMWSWCPSSVDGCSVEYSGGEQGTGDHTPQTKTWPAGSCVLSSSSGAAGVTAFFKAAGSEVSFSSGYKSLELIALKEVQGSDCSTTCSKLEGAGVFTPINGGTKGTELCLVFNSSYGFFFGSTNASSPYCAYRETADSLQSASSGYLCACIRDQDRGRATWEPTLYCPCGAKPAFWAPNACRVWGADAQAFKTGWIAEDTCFTPEAADEGGVAQGIKNFNMSVLCVK